MLRKCPLIVILGSTGTGKTKLSIEIAKKFKGEVIGADSMQVYKGLDIVTAKATKEEQSQAVHHLLDVAQPGETFTVVHYKQKALEIISNLLSKNILPIIVGGTNYYIESILWKVLVDPPTNKNLDAPRPSLTDKNISPEDSSSDSDDNVPSSAIKFKQSSNCDVKFSLDDEKKWEFMSGAELHDILKKVDSVSAQRLHPNNKRKIMRSLQIYLHTGKTHTEILLEQRNPKQGGCAIGGPLRFDNVILFWLRCEQEVLDKRLDSRVDSMMEEGLIDELKEFRDLYVRTQDAPDYTLGILQTIGLKELTPYLEYIEKTEDVDELHKNKLLKECLDNLKLVTRRYARKQNRWVRNRFLGYKDRQVPPLYGLDTSNPSKWNEMVRDPAFHIIESYLSDQQPKVEPLEQIVNPNAADDLNPEVTHFCEVCQRIFIGDYQWQLHTKSKKHQRVAKSKAKGQKVDGIKSE
ncbi:tRNA dimethylallyltransferase-like [Ctenocephalides felis]|uniref:tRNA dimethylallyltransferase-like n=1 Tax=Ctenocephalides felis TaxID=7515 RepID=UPI000E6E3FC5|nr:tRNA dimethylallyltransferase-like [Ctenocephalides felis]